MACLEQSRSRLADDLDRVQKKAFTKWVNSHLEKVGIEIEDLFQDLRDGSILLLLVELFTGMKLKRERGKMKVHHLQNVRSAMDYLTDKRKIKIVGIQAEEIVAGNKKLTLGLIWTLILNFELSGSIKMEERPTSPQQVSAKVIKDELLQWSTKATEGYDDMKISNFHSSWKNGMSFCAIINRHRPDLLDFDECDPEKPLENLEKAFSIAEKELDVIRFLDPEDVNVEKPSEQAILMYVSALKQAFPDMPPPHRKKGPSISPEDYTSAYASLQNWIQSRIEVASNEALPPSVNEVNKLLKEFQELRKMEDSEKAEEKEKVKTMAAEIKVFELKSKENLGVPNIKELEEAWSNCMTVCDNYETRLKQELSRLEGLEELVLKVESECKSLGTRLELIEEQVELIESEGGASAEDEEIVELQGKLKSVKDRLEGLENSIQLLKEGNHPKWNQLDEIVSIYWKTLSSVRSRLEGCIVSVSDIQLLLTEADGKLRTCERWLLEHGKFSDNQLIVEQKSDYELFRETELAEAETIMGRIGSSPISGHEEEVRELNKRWQQIQEQLGNRISNLTTVTETVAQFDTVKVPLQQWCVTQQEEKALPLLETDLHELKRQKEQFQKMLDEVLTYEEAVETLEDLSANFFKHKEPIQTFADKYARKLKRMSRNFADITAKDPSITEEENVTLFEQSEILRSEFERNKSRVRQRLQQVEDLAQRLEEFDKKYSVLLELVNEGTALLEREKPIGSTANRIAEQTATCQAFRVKLTDSQSDVDTMLALGRSIISENYTNPNKDTLSLKLTGFISTWANLLMSWQNWADELHATGEQSRNLSDQFTELQRVYEAVSPVLKELFPAKVSMETLEADLKHLLDRHTREVHDPLLLVTKHYDSLTTNVHLLSDKESVERVLAKFEPLLKRVESRGVELNSLVDSVGYWWTECATVKGKVAEMRQELCEELPLAGSREFIKKQDEKLQDLVMVVEETGPKVTRTLKHLTSLAEQESLLVCAPIVSYKDELQQHWKELHDQVDSRRDTVEIGRVRLNIYVENRDPLDKWLTSAEAKLQDWSTVSGITKEDLVTLTESLRGFKMEVEMHCHEMESCESMAKKYCEIAKKYQSNLLVYRQKLHPEVSASGILPEHFYDWETEGFSIVTPVQGACPLLHDSAYHNGLQVVNDDINYQKKRFNRLKGRVSRRSSRFTEARDKQLTFQDSLDAVLPTLEATETLLQQLQDKQVASGNKNLKEQMELLEKLEGEFSVLRSLMDPLHLAAASWTVREPIDSEGEEEEDCNNDTCTLENEKTQKRYLEAEASFRNTREMMESSLAEAQAFQSSYSSFVSWLRDTERKIQKDDPLKLEVTDLRSGLAYLKAVASDISSHSQAYNELCKKLQATIEVAKTGEKEEQLEMFGNLESRWNGLQVIHEDVDAIMETIALLESFNSSYHKLVKKYEDLIGKLTQFSPSAITSEDVNKKKLEFKELLNEFETSQSELNALLLEYDSLFNTLFDQTKFLQLVDGLKEKIQEAKKLKDDKNRAMKHIVSRITSLEVNWAEFESWLSTSEKTIEELNDSLSTANKENNLATELKNIQVLHEDVADHESGFDAIESSVSSLTTYLEQHHMEKLETRFTNLSVRYRCLCFSCEAFPVQVWLHNRSTDLRSMNPCAVSVALLQSQINKSKKFLIQVQTYDHSLNKLREALAALSGQRDIRGPEGKMSTIEAWYAKLEKICEQRIEVVTVALPRLKLYEASLDNWEGSLNGWVESTDQLAPPTTNVLIIQSTIENIKMLLVKISDQEPEFHSLVREARQMYVGSKEQRLLFERVKTLSSHQEGGGTPERMEVCPGQLELQGRLDSDHQKLEKLKKRLHYLLETFNTLNDKSKVINQLLNELLPWLQEQKMVAEEELGIKELKHKTLEGQLSKCQALINELQCKEPQKKKLSNSFSDISTCLSSDKCDDVLLPLEEKVNQILKIWSDLLEQLSKAQSVLGPTVKLAKSFEDNREKLMTFLKVALIELTSLGPIPSESEAVHELRIRIDELKSDYSEFMPLMRECLDNGRGLMTHGSTQNDLKKQIDDLESKWNSVGTLLSEIHQKLTDALVQTQEFQQVAESMNRWVNATQTSLKKQDPVAVRVRLIQPQIDNLKPVLEDIKVNSTTLDQAKSIGEQLLVEATTEERLKIGKKLHSLEARFYSLEKSARTRMKDLQDALVHATTFENNCSALASQLIVLEEELDEVMLTPVRSQPLRSLAEQTKEFSQRVLSVKPLVDSVSSAETALFQTDTETIKKYELQENFIDYLSSPHHRGPSPYHRLSPRSTTPTGTSQPQLSTIGKAEFMDRPGALEVLETGAKLHGRFEKLKFTGSRRIDELTSLLDTVIEYEENCARFAELMENIGEKIQKQNMLMTSCDELKTELQKATSLQDELTREEGLLESINVTGTALVDCCRDELSKDSVRESLSELNDKWGTAQSKLDNRIEEIQKGIQLTDRYEAMERDFQTWLSDCETKLDKPVTVTGSDSEIQQIVRKHENILSDIDAHKPQLDALVTSGQDLESFALSSIEASMPKLFLGYEDCQRRYKDLIHKLEDKMTSTVDDVQKASQLKNKLMTVLGKLKPLKAALDNHDPPHLFPEPVTEQIQQLENHSEEYKTLEKEVMDSSKIASSFHLQDGSELYNLHDSVVTTSEDIKKTLKLSRDKLMKARNSAVHFDKDQKLFTQWMKGVQEYLDKDEGLRATVEGVKGDMEALKECTEDISNHSQPLQKLMDQGKDMMVGASPEDCIVIGDCLAHLQSSYESLQRHAFGKTQMLKDGCQKVEAFNQEHKDLCDQINSKETVLTMPFQVGTEVETVGEQLEDFKEFEAELLQLKGSVSSCVSKGKQLKDTCHHEDKPKVEAKLDELNTEWGKLQTLSIARQQELENALLRLGQFREALKDLLAWITECADNLEKKKEPGIDVEQLEQQINDLKALQSEIVSREPSVISLNEASQQLLSQEDDPSSIEIQRDMNDLNKKWQSLKSKAAGHQLSLSTAHERARVFDNHLKQLMRRFNSAEERTSEDWKAHGLPITCQQELDDHQQLTNEVLSLKEPLVNIKAEAEGLQPQASQKDCGKLSKRLEDLDDRLKELEAVLEEKQSQLEAAKEVADELDGKLVTMATAISSLEQQMNKPFTIFAEADEVKKQLKEHKAFLNEMDKCSTELELVEGMGGALIKQCVSSDGDVIKKQLAKLRSRLDQLQSSALARLSDLDEALLTVGKFEEAYMEQRGWLGQAWDKLQSLEPIPAQSEAVAALISKHKIFQKELSARASSHNSVIKASKDLMRTKQGEDKSVLKGKIADMEHEWNAVDKMSTAYQQKLDSAIKKLRQFEPQAQNIQQWMKKVFPILDDSLPVDGDIGTVEELIKNHETFQNQFGAHQGNIDRLIALGEELLNGVVDEDSPLKENLEEIKDMWEKLCTLSVNKQDRLLKARNTSIQFQENVHALWSWMEQKEMELDLMDPPTEDEQDLNQQMIQQAEFEESIYHHQATYDGVIEGGHNLLRVSHPRAEPVLSGQLQQLEQKWKQLKEKMQSRSEALNSLMLEMHGLQDSIEELSDWVKAAEQDMKQAEDTPIGDDLESVEEQLNQHESFQEEMAKHQPKMEALNKANKRRKSRVSAVPGSSSNPDITKSISSLDKRWKRLWYRSNERHRQLLETRTRLKDIALARSFNFDAWCKRFVTWVDQQKLRVSDLFRRFDNNHDGMLTRDEFMKGLKASGLAMNQIEMEKIADEFDRNRSGLIDLAEITAILKGQKVHKQYKTAASAKPISDSEKIDLEIQRQISKCCCEHKFQAVPVKAGQYKFGDSQKLRMVRILRSTVMVRVGGGWEPLDAFLAKNDPCRVSGRTNTDLLTGIGLGKATFKSKVQTIIHNKDMKKLAEEGPADGVTVQPQTVKTKYPHSGRRETTVVTTKKNSVPAIKTTTTNQPTTLQRTYTGSNLGTSALKRPTTPSSSRTSSFSRYMSPPESRVRPPSRTGESKITRPPSRSGESKITRPPSRTGESKITRPPSRSGESLIRPPSRSGESLIRPPSRSKPHTTTDSNNYSQPKTPTRTPSRNGNVPTTPADRTTRPPSRGSGMRLSTGRGPGPNGGGSRIPTPSTSRTKSTTQK